MRRMATSSRASKGTCSMKSPPFPTPMPRPVRRFWIYIQWRITTTRIRIAWDTSRTAPRSSMRWARLLPEGFTPCCGHRAKWLRWIVIKRSGREFAAKTAPAGSNAMCRAGHCRSSCARSTTRECCCACAAKTTKAMFGKCSAHALTWSCEKNILLHGGLTGSRNRPACGPWPANCVSAWTRSFL